MTAIRRRKLLFGIAGGAALGRLPGWSIPAAAQGATPTAADPYAEAVDLGLAYVRPLAAEHTRLAEALRDAIAAGDADLDDAELAPPAQARRAATLTVREPAPTARRIPTITVSMDGTIRGGPDDTERARWVRRGVRR